MAQALEFLFHLNFFFGLKMSLLDSVSMNFQKLFLLLYVLLYACAGK